MRNQNVSSSSFIECWLPPDRLINGIALLDKMCVPDLMFSACTQLVESTTSQYASIRCVAARDRMECLEKVNKREADFVAVDPEDMYVAFQMKNEDFSVFSEIRTVEEPDGERR